MTTLDVACGTGLVAREAIGIIGDAALLTGLDPTPGMLAQARQQLGIKTVQAFAEDIPVVSDHFDFLSMGYALRHISDLGVAFAEYRRVLKPGGRIMLLEITHPTSWIGRTLMRCYVRGVVPLLSLAMGRRRAVGKLWEYYYDTIEACIPPHEVVESLAQAGFRDVKRGVQLGVFSEYTATNPGVPAPNHR